MLYALSTEQERKYDVTKLIVADEAMDAALTLLGAGEIVAIPTETVYGLAGDATNGDAVVRIFKAKGRPRFNPLITHVADMTIAERIGVFDPLSRKLANAFWPGPLTLVVPIRPEFGIHPLVTAGLDTIALRMPWGFGRKLIVRLGRPLAAPSANSSGKISSTSGEAVANDLGGRIPLVVDGGPTSVGLESTIIKVEGSRARLLRPGGIAAGEIEIVVKSPLLRGVTASIEAPGMLVSHYVPGAAMRLNANRVNTSEALLGFGTQRADGWQKAHAFLNLSESGDLREAATSLFSHLQALEGSGASLIAVEPIPTDALGEAINDRLARAAAPYDITHI